MRFIITAIALLSTSTALAADCGQVTASKTSQIATQIQRSKANGEKVTSCEINIVLAAEQKHNDMTGGACADLTQVRLVKTDEPNFEIGREITYVEQKVTVVNSGEGQPADTYSVRAYVPGSGEQCEVTSVKLDPIGEGLPSPVETPFPSREQN